jgi:hypothetical protein
MATSFTATPDVTNARVIITAAGGVAGDRFYMQRRDRNGSQLIRETSEAGAMWLTDPAKVRTQLARNPSFESLSVTTATTRTQLLTNPTFQTNLTGLTAAYGTSGAGTLARQEIGGVDNSAFARMTWTTATTVVSGNADLTSTQSLTTGAAALSIYVRVLRANQRLQLSIIGTAATGATGIVNPAVDAAFGTWVRLTWQGTIATAGTFGLRVSAVTGGSGRAWDVDDILDLDHALAEQRPVVDTYFDGSTAASGDFTHAWSGTAHASSSIQRGILPTYCAGGSAAAISSTQWALNGTKSVRIIPTSLTSNDSYASPEGDSGALRFGMVAGKTYTVSASVRLTAAQSGTLHANARKINVRTKVGAAAYVDAFSAAAPNAAGIYRLSVTVTTPAGVTEAFIRLYNGASRDGGDVWWDSLLVEETSTLQPYFDGSTGANHVWTGTVNQSTATNSDAALPITLHDYEARQGLETDYILTNEDGVISDSERIVIPAWGTWLKDPFRPFMNAKVLWNSDSEYTRPAQQVVLKARGAKFPVVQSDRRMAPNGTIRVLTTDEDEARKLVALLDTTNTVMVDVDLAWGVPVRYVAIGDITGSRTSTDTDRNLSWEERFWDLPIQEVAAPIGAPIAQSLTYESIPANFGAYISLPASIATYNDLASGNWGQ